MKQVVLMGPIGFTVHVHQITLPPGIPQAGQTERGVRIEVRRVQEEAVSPSPYASLLTSLKEPVWRADLFAEEHQPQGVWDRAHYHPLFHGYEGVKRQWQESLTTDPAGWVRVQLENLPDLLRAGDAQDLVDHVDPEELKRVVPVVMTMVEASLSDIKNQVPHEITN